MENGLVAAYENMDHDQLISVITQQKMEINELAAVGKAYKQHLEETIEYRSVEKYLNLKNREAEEIAPQEAMRKIQTIKITIFENAHDAMKQAIKERDSAMVAAIAEIIKSI